VELVVVGLLFFLLWQVKAQTISNVVHTHCEVGIALAIDFAEWVGHRLNRNVSFASINLSFNVDRLLEHHCLSFAVVAALNRLNVTLVETVIPS